MRAILIDPIKREVTEVQIRHALEGDTLGDLQKAVGGAHSPFAGPGIIVGHNSAGNTTPAKSTLEEIKRRIKWQTRP